MELMKRRLLRDENPPHPLIKTIREVCAQMDATQLQFAEESDPDLIEASIYEMQALRARYRYLLRTARLQGVTCQERAHLWDE